MRREKLRLRSGLLNAPSDRHVPETASQYCTQRDHPDEGGDLLTGIRQRGSPFRAGSRSEIYLAREAVSDGFPGWLGFRPQRISVRPSCRKILGARQGTKQGRTWTAAYDLPNPLPTVRLDGMAENSSSRRKDRLEGSFGVV